MGISKEDFQIALKQRAKQRKREVAAKMGGLDMQTRMAAVEGDEAATEETLAPPDELLDEEPEQEPEPRLFSEEPRVSQPGGEVGKRYVLAETNQPIDRTGAPATSPKSFAAWLDGTQTRVDLLIWFLVLVFSLLAIYSNKP